VKAYSPQLGSICEIRHEDDLICDAGRKVRENVTDAIEKAKLLRMIDRQLVPVASSRSRGR
jgi:hypothetical protein